MGVLSPPGPFLQKKTKKRPKKFFEEREGNSISCPGRGNFLCRDKKWNFPPAVWNFLIFLPSIWKSCFGLFCLSRPFLAFLAFFGLFLAFLIVKHSLDVGITSKMEESHILHGKNVPPWIFFSPQTEVYPRASLPPLGLNYSPRFARA